MYYFSIVHLKNTLNNAVQYHASVTEFKYNMLDQPPPTPN